MSAKEEHARPGVDDFTASVLSKIEISEYEGLSNAEVEAMRSKYGFDEVVIKEPPVHIQILSRYLGIVPLFITLTAILSDAIFTDCADDEALDPCQCRRLTDCTSFVLLIIGLNLLVYADYAGSKSSGDNIRKRQEASAATVGVKRDGE